MTMIRHCEICGAQFKSRGNNHKICSECIPAAQRRWYKKRKQKQEVEDLYTKPDRLADKVKEINEYNEKHGTNYSYGMYMAFKRLGKL